MVIRKPDFFIVGAPKCGTTAMAHYLGRHPDVFMARKEMHHFGADLQFGPQFYRRDQSAYLAEFENWNDQRRGGEASVWYLYSSTAAEELKAFNPEARVIIMLRNPVEMLYSLYYSFLWDGNEHLPTFERALGAQEERRKGEGAGRQTYFAQGLVYRDVARYTEQVERYFNTFGRDRVHIILYDDISADVTAAYRQALFFLGVDPLKGDDDFEAVNTNKFVKSQILRTALNDPLVRSTVVALRRWLPDPVFRGMQKIDARVRRFNTRAASRPPMSAELRGELMRWFTPEVERLGALLRRDLSHWTNNYGFAGNVSLPSERGHVTFAPNAAPALAAGHFALQTAVTKTIK